MQRLVRTLSTWAYSTNSPVMWLRRRRLRAFLRLVAPPPGARIVDLGGTPWTWSMIDHDFDITLVNLPGSTFPVEGTRAARSVAADGCDLSSVFDDGEFDIAFSNSTIEHVGDELRQAAFAREARRIARSYWVQTPSDRFPLEAHTGVLYYWRRSEESRARMIRRWERELPGWTEMIRGTRVLSRARMHQLFPDGRVHVERVLGLEKSYAAYKPWRPAPEPARAAIRTKRASAVTA